MTIIKFAKTKKIMLKYILSALLVFGLFHTPLGAQSLIKLENTDQSNEVLPAYQGGQDALYLFIAQNLNYPEEAKANGTQGMALVKFNVNTDGSVSNLELLKDPGNGCGAAAMNIVNLTSGNWNAGTINDEAVVMSYQLPISFVIPEKREVIE